jgi:hypothetical protein
MSQIMMAPLDAFTYGLEILAGSLRLMQDVADRSIGVMAGSNEARPEPVVMREEGHTVQPVTNESGTLETQTIQKETTKMRDTDLRNRSTDPDCKPDCDILKLVRYKILFVMRDYECAFPEAEELVAEDLTESAYTGWKIAEFIQNLDNEEFRARAPQRWRDYLRQECDGGTHPNDDDKKFLRVYFEVLERYPREKLRYEEDQLAELRNINRNLARIGGRPAE